jgi:Type II secretion system (T2SS), protein E, N-terminal domain
MAKLKIGEMLVRANLITETDLRIALAQQKTHGGRIGEHLIRINVLSQEHFSEVLALQLGLTYNDLSTPPIPAVLSLVPEKIAVRLQLLPTAYDPRSNTLAVAVSDPLNDAPLKEVARITGKVIIPQVCPANVLRRGIEHAYFSVDLHDEGTNEFQLVDIHGRGKIVRVSDDHELPELGTAEMMPLDDLDMGSEHVAVHDEQKAETAAAPGPMRIFPESPAAPGATAAQRPPSVGPQPSPVVMGTKPVSISGKPAPSVPPAHSEAGEEALHMVMAIADLLIERGYFTRAELMRTLRK